MNIWEASGDQESARTPMSGDDLEDALEQSYVSNFQLSFHPGIGASV
jgi:hypothetical protein